MTILVVNTISAGPQKGKPMTVRNCGLSYGTQKSFARHIVAGEHVQEGELPWMVAVFKERQFWCGAAILNERWIISAAHCFDE